MSASPDALNTSTRANPSTVPVRKTSNPANRRVRSSGTCRSDESSSMSGTMVNYRSEPLTGGGDTRKYRVVSTRVARSSRPGSTSLEVVKLVEPTCDEGAGRVETMVRVSGILWSGLLFGCRVVSTRVARSSRPGSTSLEVVKLVEPTCDEGAGRVETMVRVSGILWSGLLFGCRVVSTRVARSSRPGSTSLGVVKLVEPACSLCELVVSKPGRG